MMNKSNDKKEKTATSVLPSLDELAIMPDNEVKAALSGLPLEKQYDILQKRLKCKKKLAAEAAMFRDIHFNTLTNKKFLDYLEDEADLNARDAHGRTMLLMACQSRNERVMRVLVDAKADVDIQNEYGHTALMHAIEFGMTSAAKYMIDAKANVQLQDHNGATALYSAIKYQRSDDVLTLLEAKADCWMQIEPWPWNDTPRAKFRSPMQGALLYRASRTEDILNACLAQSPNEDGMTALMAVASLIGRPPTGYLSPGRRFFDSRLSLAIRLGEDIHATDKYGMTALMIAVTQYCKWSHTHNFSASAYARHIFLAIFKLTYPDCATYSEFRSILFPMINKLRGWRDDPWWVMGLLDSLFRGEGRQDLG